METKKMSLVNIQGRMSRAEMKKIMAGSGTVECNCNSADDCETGILCYNRCGGPVNGKYGACGAG
ncbi:MAG: hypothetical protein H0U27_15115 [Nitrosopumilus sp.]|nr:hypothetical protein [Nitrosopumilus sp.]